MDGGALLGTGSGRVITVAAVLTIAGALCLLPWRGVSHRRGRTRDARGRYATVASWRDTLNAIGFGLVVSGLLLALLTG